MADTNKTEPGTAKRREETRERGEVARSQELFDLGHIGWSKVDASGTPEETLIRAEAMLDH